MTLPVYVPAHHKANKPETDPTAPGSSYVEGNPSFHDSYYVKVSFPRIHPPTPPTSFLSISLCPTAHDDDPDKEATIAIVFQTGLDITTHHEE
jgi:hypothetical protein